MFYVYLWLREDGTPYYVGKGTKNRAYRKHGTHKAPPLGRIVFYISKDEADAFETEVALIWYYGRKDLGLGCLRNLTDGGENPPNCKGKLKGPLTKEHRIKLSKSHKGKPSPNKGKTFSEEAKRNMSLAHKGKPNPNKGKTFSEDVKHNMSLSHEGKHFVNSGSFLKGTVPWNKGTAMSSEERREKHNEASRKYYKNKKLGGKNEQSICVETIGG